MSARLRLPRLVASGAPAERLAAFRIALGTFVLVYLALRLPAFAALADRPSAAFEGAGVLGIVDQPLPAPLYLSVLGAALISGVGFTAGYRYSLTAPFFAGLVLVLTSYRSSWGQLLHFENLFTLHLLVMAIAPACDVWSLDARRRSRSLGGRGPGRESSAYAWPLQLACLIVVLTYTIAGIAKLRYGGLAWVTGDALRNHVAASAARLELLGGRASPLASLAVPVGWAFPPLAAVAVAVELAAPVALFGGRWRTSWVVATWSMHLGILALMLVGFPYPLFGVAFAPFFALERLGMVFDRRRRIRIDSGSGIVA